MTKKSGRVNAKSQAEAVRRARSENPNYRVIEVKKLYTVYHVEMKKKAKSKSGRSKR